MPISATQAQVFAWEDSVKANGWFYTFVAPGGFGDNAIIVAGGFTGGGVLVPSRPNTLLPPSRAVATEPLPPELYAPSPTRAPSTPPRPVEAPAPGVAPPKAAPAQATQDVAFAPGTSQSAVSKLGRVDHAGRHLSEYGVLTGKQGTTAFRDAVRTNLQRILENPCKTFDHVMERGGQRVTGFYGRIDGKDVVIFVAKEPRGKSIEAGDVVTSITPSPQQMINWGLK